jgi:hypothetical protein
VHDKRLEREWKAAVEAVWAAKAVKPAHPMKFVAVIGSDGVLKTWVRPAGRDKQHGRQH